MIKHLLTVIILLSLSMSGCVRLKKHISDISPNKIYEIAQKKLRYRKWKEAIIQLETLDNYYPFSSYSRKVQLDLIYAYYKNADFSLAKETIDRIIRLDPLHSNMDYIIYMYGLINMRLDNNILQKFFGIDRCSCDPQHARDAFDNFSKLVHKYPESKYITDATKRLSYLRDRLAKYEYSIANYYAHRGAWIAVINRVESILRDYPDAQITLKSMKLMENAYRQIYMIEQADKIARKVTDMRNTNSQ